MIKRISKNRFNLITLIFSLLFGLYFYIFTHENLFTHSNNLHQGLPKITWMYLGNGRIAYFYKKIVIAKNNPIHLIS